MANAVNDLRSFISLLREKGALCEIASPVDPVHELGAILRSAEQAGKAALFHKVEGSPIPLIGSVLGSHDRIAMALGCTREEIGDILGNATKTPIPCEQSAEAAPCQEVIIDDVDLSYLPVPTHAPKDAGPYINAGIVIGREPDGGRLNLSYVRFQVKGKDKIGVNLNTWRHLREFFEASEKEGKNLPFCVAIGVDPALMLAASYRYDGDEYEIAGALRGKPVPVVKAQTCDIMVPTHAEIILECEIIAGERETEGPMAEYTGHYSGIDDQPVGRVLRITHRNKPIFQTIAGTSFEHLLLGTAVTREPILREMAVATSPRVKDVLLPPYASGFLAIIAMENPNPGEARSVALAAMHSHVNISTVLIVDTDIDIFNPTDLLWAISTRVRWERDIVVIPDAMGNELHPSASREGAISKMIIDATLAPELRERFTKVVYERVDINDYINK